MDVTSYLLGKNSSGGSGEEYKETAIRWGNSFPTMAYYLAGNWGDPTPHTYTYEELQTLAPQSNQIITAGITDMQTSKYKLNQTINALAQKGLTPSKYPNLQGDRIGEFVDALISQIQKLG